MEGKIIFGISLKEAWSIIHGVVFGGGLLLLFPVVIAGLFLLGRRSINQKMLGTYLRYLIYATWILTIFAWLVNIVGTYFPYPWYRIQPSGSITDLHKFPRQYLLSLPHLAIWENIGMKWKEYLGWVVPILCTTASYIVSVDRESIVDVSKLRKAVMTMFLIAFIAAAITGLFGILITKLAPVR